MAREFSCRLASSVQRMVRGYLVAFTEVDLVGGIPVARVEHGAQTTVVAVICVVDVISQGPDECFQGV